METQLERHMNGGLNPWFSIWTRPRDTMKGIYQSPPNKVFLLFYVGAFVQILDRAGIQHFGDSMHSLILIIVSALFGSLIGASIYYYLLPALLCWVGRKLGGQGTTERVRYSVAYSYIPSVFTLVLIWVPSILLFGIENFTTFTPKMDSSTTLTVLFYLLEIVDFVIAFWAIMIFFKCLGEAHRFSVWKALSTSILSILVIIIPILVIALLVSVL